MCPVPFLEENYLYTRNSLGQKNKLQTKVKTSLIRITIQGLKTAKAFDAFEGLASGKINCGGVIQILETVGNTKAFWVEDKQPGWKCCSCLLSADHDNGSLGILEMCRTTSNNSESEDNKIYPTEALEISLL